MSNIRLLNCSKLVINRKNNNDATFCCYDALLKDFWRCFVSFFKINYWFKFHVWYRSGLGLSCLVLEFSKFSFIKDWPEFRISRYTPVWVFSISGDWGELGIPNLAQTSLKKFYWMLLNATATAFTISKLLR